MEIKPLADIQASGNQNIYDTMEDEDATNVSHLCPLCVCPTCDSLIVLKTTEVTPTPPVTTITKVTPTPPVTTTTEVTPTPHVTTTAEVTPTPQAIITDVTRTPPVTTTDVTPTPPITMIRNATVTPTTLPMLSIVGM